MSELRPELTKMPARIAALPVFRGYPVPYFVAYPNGPEGEPEFRGADAKKWVECVKYNRCWVCGDTLGVNIAFVLGPMCGITRSTSEPACHRDCAEWAIENCPFLTRPHMVRRDDNLPEGIEPPPGEPILRNPGVTLLWMTHNFTLFRAPDKKLLIRVGDPFQVVCYTAGRKATRSEVDESVAEGLPTLIELAKMDGPEAEDELVKRVREFEFYMPAK